VTCSRHEAHHRAPRTWRDSHEPSPHRSPGPLLALLLLVVAAPLAAAAPNYRVVPLGTLGGPSSSATQVNERGEVTGVADLASQQGGAQNAHAFLWSSGTMLDLGASNPVRDDSYFCSCSSGVAVNDRGDVAGLDLFNENAKAAFWGAGLAGRTITDGVARGLNDTGLVVGEAGDVFNTRSPFVFDGTSLRLLEPPGLMFGSAADVNDAGTIVGVASVIDRFGGARHPFVAHGGAMQLLPFAGEATAVNDSDTIVGAAAVNRGRRTHAFVAGTDLVEHDLGTLGGRDSQASAVSASGAIVGWSQTARGGRHAFVVLAGRQRMLDLNRLIPKRLGLELVDASGVNAAGQIAATAVPHGGGPQQAVLLIPR
jgi:probable HAF family extracellular repeat protein